MPCCHTVPYHHHPHCCPITVVVVVVLHTVLGVGWWQDLCIMLVSWWGLHRLVSWWALCAMLGWHHDGACMWLVGVVADLACHVGIVLWCVGIAVGLACCDDMALGQVLCAMTGWWWWTCMW